MALLTQRFADAVRTLVGDGPIKQRLTSAYATHLGDLGDAEIPAGLRRDFTDLQIALSRIAPVGKETRVRATVQKMSTCEAHEHAAAIVKLYVDLLNGAERSEPLRVVEPPRKPPRFLATRP